jgi:hypothetical protein
MCIYVVYLVFDDKTGEYCGDVFLDVYESKSKDISFVFKTSVIIDLLLSIPFNFS